jgi:hypothetical protein
MVGSGASLKVLTERHPSTSRWLHQNIHFIDHGVIVGDDFTHTDIA